MFILHRALGFCSKQIFEELCSFTSLSSQKCYSGRYVPFRKQCEASALLSGQCPYCFIGYPPLHDLLNSLSKVVQSLGISFSSSNRQNWCKFTDVGRQLINRLFASPILFFQRKIAFGRSFTHGVIEADGFLNATFFSPLSFSALHLLPSVEFRCISQAVPTSFPSPAPPPPQTHRDCTAAP
jgi:hypothetical protein